jgi:hypothetical protein
MILGLTQVEKYKDWKWCVVGIWHREKRGAGPMERSGGR